MSTRTEFGPQPPGTSGLDAFIEAIRISRKKNDGSYLTFFEKIPEKERASLLKELFCSHSSLISQMNLVSLMKEVPPEDRMNLFQQLAEQKDSFFRDSLYSLLDEELLGTDLMSFLEKAMNSEYSEVRELGLNSNLFKQLSASQQTSLIEKGLKDSDVMVRRTSLLSLEFSKIPLLQKIVFIEKALNDSNTGVSVLAIGSLKSLPEEKQIPFQGKVSTFLKSYFNSSTDLSGNDASCVVYALEADRAVLLRDYMKHSSFVPSAAYRFILSVPETDRTDLIKIGLESSSPSLFLAAIKVIDQAGWNNREELNSLALKKIKV